MAIIEIVVTAIFVLIVLGTTDESGVPKGFGPIAAGFGLTLVHMISIPVSNTSVNPARSIATAVFQGDWALGQVWAFIVFPIIGAAVAAGIWMVVGPQTGRRRHVRPDRTATDSDHESDGESDVTSGSPGIRPSAHLGRISWALVSSGPDVAVPP